MPRVLVGLGDELAAALAALGHGQHLVLHEAYQAPGPRDGQLRIEPAHPDLLGVELVGLDQRVDALERAGLGEVGVDVVEQRGVDVGLPRQEPVSRERQLALGGRLARHFLVEAQETLVGEFGLALQDLEPGTHLEQADRPFDLTRFTDDAFVGGH